jgi:hypothetical protein
VKLPNQDIKVIPYSEEFSAAHREFATKMWPNKRRRREEEYQRWKFRGPAQGNVDGLLLAVAENRVVGQLGLIPCFLRFGNTVYPCQWVCDIIVDSSLRRGGVGTLMLKTAMARDMVTLGSNPSPSADITMTRAGFRPLNGPRVMVLPLKLDYVLGWVIPASLKKMIPVVSMVGQPVAAYRSRSLAKRNPTSSVASSGWEEILPLIDARQRASGHPHVLHDRAFMQWRCSGLTGYTAPLETLRTDNGFAVVGAANPSYSVYEWAAPNKEEFHALFRAIYAKAAVAGCEIVSAFANEAREEQWLREVGFMGMRTRVNVICYPPEKLIPEYDRFYYSIYDSDGNL